MLVLRGKVIVKLCTLLIYSYTITLRQCEWLNMIPVELLITVIRRM